MHATIAPPRLWNAAPRWVANEMPCRDTHGPASADEAVELRAELAHLRQRYCRLLQTLAEVGERADRAEQRLRGRLVALTWPAALGGLGGGFAAIMLLWLAGA